MTTDVGVAVALTCALEHPARVAGLALVNGFAHYEARRSLRLARAAAALVPRTLFRVGRRSFAAWAFFEPRRDEDALRAFHELSGAFFDAAYRRRMALIERLDLRPRLGGIACPVGVYASDRDRIVDAVRAGRASSNRPGVGSQMHSQG